MDRVVESNIRGRGALILRNLMMPPIIHEVRYHLDVYQRMLGPDQTIPGLEQARGTIAPVYFFGLSDVTLHLEDGRKMTLRVTDLDGTVVSTGQFW